MLSSHSRVLRVAPTLGVLILAAFAWTGCHSAGSCTSDAPCDDASLPDARDAAETGAPDANADAGSDAATDTTAMPDAPADVASDTAAADVATDATEGTDVVTTDVAQSDASPVRCGSSCAADPTVCDVIGGRAFCDATSHTCACPP